MTNIFFRRIFFHFSSVICCPDPNVRIILNLVLIETVVINNKIEVWFTRVFCKQIEVHILVFLQIQAYRTGHFHFPEQSSRNKTQDESNLNFLLLYRMSRELLQYGPQGFLVLIWNNAKMCSVFSLMFHSLH